MNASQAARLYTRVTELAGLDAATNVLDLYCGVGAMTLLAARAARRSVGIETAAPAVVCAERNARDNRIENARFIRADVRRALVDALRGPGRRGPQAFFETPARAPLVAIVNPPRAGLGKDVVDLLAALEPQRIVYVSCDPGTLARDLARLDKAGYRTTDVAPFDMFPHSYHIETVVRLERADPGARSKAS